MRTRNKSQLTGKFPRSAAPASGAPDREVTALLAALSVADAYGWIGEDARGQRLFVVAARNGVSVRVASFDPAVGATAASHGLAIWETGAVSGRDRLVATAAGLARRARDTAPAGVDPFLAQHKPVGRTAVGVDPHAADLIVDRAESPLAWLATRRGGDGVAMIDAAQLQAGERLRRDFTMAGLEPRITADWSAIGPRGDSATAGMSYSDLAIAARQRVEAALDYVGADFAGLLLDVCGFLKGLEVVESERRWPRRSAKVLLGVALRQLARHYGIEAQAIGPRRSKGVRRWGAPDYRPAISADEAG